MFLQAVGAFRRSLEGAFLHRHAVEERLQVDVLLGDVSWETSYTLPGEDVPPRVQADISFDWSTWSQTAYRAWTVGEPAGEEPEIEVEVVVRVQRLSAPPDQAVLLGALTEAGPAVLGHPLARCTPTVEQQYDHGLAKPQVAVEVAYEGTLHLSEAVLQDPSQLDRHLETFGSWVASTLVRLADLDLSFLPPDLEDEGLH